MPFNFVGKSLSARKNGSPASNTCFSEVGPYFFKTSLVNKGFLNIFFDNQLTPFLLARKAILGTALMLRNTSLSGTAIAEPTPGIIAIKDNIPSIGLLRAK